MNNRTLTVANGPTRPAIGWEEPACLLCGARERDTVIEAQDPQSNFDGLWFAVVSCRRCGLKFTSPRPNEASIGQFYAADYSPHKPKRNRPSRHSPLAWLRGRPCVERRVLPPHGQCRLLDFGCGGGSYLERMNAQGWKVTGLDCSEAVVETVRRNLGVPVHLGTLPHAELLPRSFDVITMWHSLEHVHQPLDVLRAARELLADGGKIMIAVPNIASTPFTWFGRSWFGLELPRHLTHFTPTSLIAMLETAGYSSIGVRYVRHDDWLRSSAKLACQKSKPSLRTKLLTAKWPSRFASWMCYAAGRSDCIFATATKHNPQMYTT